MCLFHSPLQRSDANVDTASNNPLTLTALASVDADDLTFTRKR